MWVATRRAKPSVSVFGSSSRSAAATKSDGSPIIASHDGPLLPYAIKGAIRYQGESNAGKAYEYRTLFPTMIRDWREPWQEGEFPFLCEQLRRENPSMQSLLPRR